MIYYILFCYSICLSSCFIHRVVCDKVGCDRVGCSRVGCGRVGCRWVGCGRVGCGRVGCGGVGWGRVGCGRVEWGNQVYPSYPSPFKLGTLCVYLRFLKQDCSQHFIVIYSFKWGWRWDWPFYTSSEDRDKI